MTNQCLPSVAIILKYIKIINVGANNLFMFHLEKEKFPEYQRNIIIIPSAYWD